MRSFNSFRRKGAFSEPSFVIVGTLLYHNL
jgi:hypothetical protein